jgi:SRSO17 transposase
MKHDSPTIAQAIKTTLTDVVRWTQELDRLHARIVARFARPEPRRRALAFLQGILSTTSRKNGWQLAEHAREARPDGMQRLLSSAVWDTDGVRDESRARTPLSIWATSPPLWSSTRASFPKQGKHSAGVGVQ